MTRPRTTGDEWAAISATGTVVLVLALILLAVTG